MTHSESADDDSTSERTLGSAIRKISPVANSSFDKPTVNYLSPGGDPLPYFAPPRLGVAETAGFSAWEQAKLLELAGRGYRIVRKLGEGGFGVVFQAVDAAGRTVAIKMLHAGLGHERYRLRFALEAQALTRLDAPGLVRLYHYDVSGPEPMLVTEYVPGGTLAQKLHTRAAYEPQQAADSIRQLAVSVQLVHDAGLIHRDIKPSNILIGADDRLKLGDFGLAKRLDCADDLTPTGRGIGGTPEYSAPEQFRSTGECDGRADIYALGATFYRLLTGKPVFERAGPDDLVAVILRVLSEEPVPPRRLMPAVPRELEAICLKCLEKNPADRYATAADLAADLEAWQAGERPTHARPSTLAGRAKKKLRRVPKFPVAMVLIALLGLGAAFLMMDGREKLAATPPTELSTPPEPAPVDPLVAMRAEFEKDGKLELQGETGKPRWHRFPIGGPELSESPIGDGVCSFESLGMCVLELLPEAPSHHFVLRVELRFATARAEADEPPFMGLFVGGEKSVDPGDSRIRLYSFAAVHSSEGPTIRMDKNIGVSTVRIVQHPTVFPGLRMSSLATRPFEPSAIFPGPWRAFEIEVRDGGIAPRVILGAAPQRFEYNFPVDGGLLDAATIQARYASQADSLRKIDGLAGVPYRDWNPRGAVGIWGNKAAVDFKNVSFTKLP